MTLSSQRPIPCLILWELLWAKLSKEEETWPQILLFQKNRDFLCLLGNQQQARWNFWCSLRFPGPAFRQLACLHGYSMQSEHFQGSPMVALWEAFLLKLCVGMEVAGGECRAWLGEFSQNWTHLWSQHQLKNSTFRAPTRHPLPAPFQAPSPE